MTAKRNSAITTANYQLNFSFQFPENFSYGLQEKAVTGRKIEQPFSLLVSKIHEKVTTGELRLHTEFENSANLFFLDQKNDFAVIRIF